MLLLLDFSQIVISSAVDYFSNTKENISLSLLRHIALNNILSYKKKFKLSTDNMIVCLDGRDYWRKNIFPFYKQNRKKDHEDSKFDWTQFFDNFNIIKHEIKTELPFKAIEVYGCEADDIMAILSKYMCPHQDKIIIVSSDKDLIQIQTNLCNKTVQWSPFHKKFITAETNNYHLFEHIIRGDGGDGIPNILSDDDVFLVKEKRMKAIKATNIMQWESNGGLLNPESFCTSETMLNNFKRNRTLIDLTQIPEEYISKIVKEFETFCPTKNQVFDYLVKHQLRKILQSGVL